MSSPAIEILEGDCVLELAKFDENSIDAIVCDPPYGLKFMGKEFDDLGEGAQQREWHRQWAEEALRVLKPGGHLLAFGGTRTYHHLATAVEDAGFEIRDQMQWLYGSGFPKSLNVGKAIDRKRDDKDEIYQVTAWIREARNKAGITNKIINDAFGFAGEMAGHWTARKSQASVPTLDQVPKLLDVLGVKPEEVPEDIARLLLDLNGKKGQPGENWFKREVVGRGRSAIANKDEGPRHTVGASKAVEFDLTAPATEEAARWEGWGTALKPANEPIVVARKPFKGTVAENVLEHGTGAINVDGCRVGTEKRKNNFNDFSNQHGNKFGNGEAIEKLGDTEVQGRWPANVILDEEAGQLLDQEAKETPSRFFYCPKAAKKERNAGLEEFEEKKWVQWQTGNGASGKPSSMSKGRNTVYRNTHPTVKPVELMRYLIRLVTPPGGTVLDPFLGSGSTGIAAIKEPSVARFIGIEQNPEYIKIARARIEHWQKESSSEK